MIVDVERVGGVTVNMDGVVVVVGSHFKIQKDSRISKYKDRYIEYGGIG